MDAFGKIDGAFTLEVLKISAIPSDITALGAEGIKNIWHNEKPVSYTHLTLPTTPYV